MTNRWNRDWQLDAEGNFATIHNRGLGFLLAGLGLLAAALSCRTWPTLSSFSDLLDSEGSERRGFMSQAAFFVSLALGTGIVWLSLPLFSFQMGARAR